MKRSSIPVLLLSGCVLLSGCSSMLNRDYSSITVHSATPTVESDQLTIRVESYQDLVNALLYFITQGRESGTIRLYNYPYDVEKDLEAACLEVVQEDPLGAYAVDFIKYDVAPIVSCYEASIQITYRRTHEQVTAIVAATGSTAIRGELKDVLSQFQSEVALRISYFTEDEEYIQTLIREAYYSIPEAALDFPQATVYFYPDSGRQRIVEILLSYRLEQSEWEGRKATLDQLSLDLTSDLWGADGDEGLREIRQTILDIAIYNPEGGATAYHALAEHQADSLGLALTMSLLCQQLDYNCQIAAGTLDGQAHYWNVVSTQEGYRHLDLTRTEDGDSIFFSDRFMVEAGYSWDTTSTPLCGEQPEF